MKTYVDGLLQAIEIVHAEATRILESEDMNAGDKASALTTASALLIEEVKKELPHAPN